MEPAVDEEEEWEQVVDPNQPSTSRGVLITGQRGGGRKRKAKQPEDKLPKRPRRYGTSPPPDFTWQWPASDQAGGSSARQEASLGSLTDGISVEGRPLSHFVEERRRYSTYVRQYGVDGDVVQFRLRNLDQVTRPELVIARLVERMREQAMQNHPDAEWIGLNFMGGEMETPFDVQMRHPEQNTAAALFNGLAPFFESYGTDILLSELVEMAVTTVSPPEGASCENVQLPDPLPRGVVPIVNPRDCYCLARAVVVCMRYHEMTPDQFTLYSGVGNQQQLQDALELMRNAGVPLNRESYGLAALKRMQRHLDVAHPRRWRLAFFRSTVRNACLQWRGPQRAQFLVSVINFNDHFHALVRPGNLFGSNARFCVDCNKSIRRSGDHRYGCPNICSCCQREGLEFPCTTPAGEHRIECGDCGISFASRNCYEYHRLNFNPQTGKARKAICERRKRCGECGKIYTVGKKNADGTIAEHECKSTKCRRCGVDHEPDQIGCFVRNKADDQWHPKKVVRYVFWDAETTSDRVVRVGNVQGQKHVANQIVAHVYCEKCMDSGACFDQPSNCKYCKVRRVFFGPMNVQPPMRRFITWLFSKAPKTHTIAIAHNSGKFDSHLALEEILTRPKLRITRNVSQGRKIYELEVRHEKHEVHFKDSVNFFHCRLADLPKAFGFQDEQKGFFPYALNTTGNERLRLPRLPDPSLYDRDNMDAVRQTEFDEWYTRHRDEEFYMGEQLRKYCEQDVVVLRKACCAFRRTFLDICQLDPFVIAATSASLALEVFLRNHLEGDDVIAAIPEYGLTPRRNQSAIAVRWLLQYAEEHQLNVRTCLSQDGEYNIPGTNYFVDGYVERDGLQPLVLEFYGYRWHGCPTCYPARDVNLIENKTAEELYQATMHRAHTIRLLGYDLTEMWECTVRSRMRTDEEFAAQMEGIEDITPLHPRDDGLRGGRTEAFVFFRRVQEGEVIHHRDFTSLYPYVMKYCELPVGPVTVLHRDRLRDHQMPWERPAEIPYKGILKVKVLPPHKCEPKPLLPYRSKDGRLLFCLCAKCGEQCNEDRCRHNDSERSFTAAYTHAELREALACGYKITAIYEVWTWDQWRSDANGIFTSYINTFLKIKLETSKLIKRPGETDHDAKLRLIQETVENEGIQLDYDKIKENPVLRAISKLMLNSLWGKFCQRSDFPEVFTFTEPDQLLRHLRNPDYAHLSLTCPNEDVCMVWSRKIAELCTGGRYTNLALPIFITSYGRLHLFDYMKKVPGNDTLYGDTDSLFYVQAPGVPDLPVAEGRLGWMVEEHPGKRIVEFFAAGAKNYGFKMVTDVENPAPDDYETELKIRGFSLRTKKAAQALRYKRIRRLVLNTYGTEEDRELMASVSDEEPDPNAPDEEEMPPMDEPELELDVPYDVILRTKESTVYGRQQIKRYKAGDRKCRKLPGFRSEPYGYVSSSDDDMH